MSDLPTLLPAPRNIQTFDGLFTLRTCGFIILESEHPDKLLKTAIGLQIAVSTMLEIHLEIYAGKVSSLDRRAITLRLDPKQVLKPQGYRLIVNEMGILIEACDEPGIYYGCCTLIQLLEYYGTNWGDDNQILVGCIPYLDILDWPDFARRGVMIDISRDKVPEMTTVIDLLDLLASWKINQVQLYTEHTFAYQQHPEVWAGLSPFTGEEILKLDAHCQEKYIELVPNQNSFGHMERWLKYSRYQPLAESPVDFDLQDGYFHGANCLCPLDPRSISFLSGLYDELLPHFSSRQFNVGCDETFDLGLGRSKAECERIGTGRVYLDFLLQIYKNVSQRGRRMQFWGDIIMGHPELINDLPKDIIALDWGYESNAPFDEHCKTLSQAGLPFYVCPGTSSWNSIAGRTDNCLKNLANAAKNGLKYGAEGYLNTDWGDYGHWQTLPVSYLGFAAGAAYSWSYQANINLDLIEAVNRFAFYDMTGNAGNLAYQLGNVYREIGIEPDNASTLFLILQNPIGTWTEYLPPFTAIERLLHAQSVIDQIAEKYLKISSSRPDHELLQREFSLTIDLLRHACMRGLFGLGSTKDKKAFLASDLDRIMAEYMSIWSLRNRPGGLNDSLSHFDIAKKEYQ